MRIWMSSAVCGALLLAAPAWAQTVTQPANVSGGEDEPAFEWNLSGRNADAYPRLEGEISVEIQNDNTFDSDDDDNELNDLFTTTEPFLALFFSPEFSIQSGMVLEPVQDPTPGEDRYFGGHGFYAETLALVYETDDFAIFGGKINPTFGVAWDITPGVFGTDIPEDYELTERIGAGGSFTLGNDDIGSHTFTAQTFFVDTTFLSESIGNDRGRTDQDDGGPSNTEAFESFSITLDGELPALVDGLSYHLGGEFQEEGEGDAESETGFVAALYGSFDIGEETSVEPLIEWAYFNDFGGEENDTDYLTVGSGFYHGPWNLALSYSGRFTDPEGASDVDDHQFQVSAGYEFESGVTLDLGYKFVEEDNVDSQVIGILFAYAFDFAVY